MDLAARAGSSSLGDEMTWANREDSANAQSGGTNAGATAAPGPADSGSAARRRHDVRRQGSGHCVPADRAASATGRCSERARGPDRRRRLRLVVGVRRTVSDAELRTPRGERAQVQPLPHDRTLLADPAGASNRPEPSCGRHGRHHRDSQLGSWVQLDPAEGRGAPRRDAQAERVLDGAVRQVPRGAGVGDEPDGAVRRLAQRWWWVRALLRLPRWRDEPVRAGALRRHCSGRAAIAHRKRATTSRRT